MTGSDVTWLERAAARCSYTHIFVPEHELTLCLKQLKTKAPEVLQKIVQNPQAFIDKMKEAAPTKLQIDDAKFEKVLEYFTLLKDLDELDDLEEEQRQEIAKQHELKELEKKLDLEKVCG